MKLFKVLLVMAGFALFFACAFYLFESSDNPTGFFAYTPSIAILNGANNAPINSNLDVSFITGRKNDLEIKTLKGKMEDIELKCNGLPISQESSKITYKDYSCKGTSIFTAKILSGDLELEFSFGNRIQAVKNTAP